MPKWALAIFWIALSYGCEQASLSGRSAGEDEEAPVCEPAALEATWECGIQCETRSCAQDCAELSLAGPCLEAYIALDACANDAGCGGADYDCLFQHCSQPFAVVYQSAPAVMSVAAVYGKLEIDLDLKIRNQSDGHLDSGLSSEPFAGGQWGEDGQLPPRGTQSHRSFAYGFEYGEGAMIEIRQQAYEDREQNHVSPLTLIIALPGDLPTGEFALGIEAEDITRLALVELDRDTAEVECLRALGVGSLNLKELSRPLEHGQVRIEGEVELCHPSHCYGQDLSALMPWDSCVP